jgi:hypothetical protein
MSNRSIFEKASWADLHEDKPKKNKFASKLTDPGIPIKKPESSQNVRSPVNENKNDSSILVKQVDQDKIKTENPDPKPDTPGLTPQAPKAPPIEVKLEAPKGWVLFPEPPEDSGDYVIGNPDEVITEDE